MKRISGKTVSLGVEIGRAIVFHSPRDMVLREKIAPEHIEKEMWRFNHAVRKSQAQLRKINRDLQKIMGEDSALIIETQYLILKDSNLLNEIKHHIRQNHVTAEWAIGEIEKRYSQIFQAIPDISFKEKSNDISDVLHRVISNLKNRITHSDYILNENIILVADDLSPSQAAKLISRKKLLGLVLNKGGETSHTVIMARSLGIPVIMDTVSATELITNEDILFIDGINGEVIINPNSSVLSEAEIKKEKFKKYQENIQLISQLPDYTTDGVPFHLFANIELPFESETIGTYGAKGIGLFRTEFLYLDTHANLSEEHQVMIYKNTAHKIYPHPLVIRTFDLGRDKIDTEFEQKKDDNPSLGVMAVRMMLRKRHVFKTQLRAIIRANTSGNIRILFPMITEIEEIHTIRELMEECWRELIVEGHNPLKKIQLGIMVEIPAVIPLLPYLKKEIDFFSVGTNDLTQYLLAVDRNNTALSYLFDSFHPAIIQSLREIYMHAISVDKEVTVCGEMAGRPLSALLLLGMGYTHLSMNAISIPEIKRIFTHVSMKELKKIIRKIYSFSSKSEIKEFFIESLLYRYPRLFLQSHLF